MPFSHILGQDTAIGTLVRALGPGRVHHAYRFEGPPGVGKELAAVALSQALVCTGGDPLGCGRCDACRRAAATLGRRPAAPLHPDVQDRRGELLPRRRRSGRSRDELTEISVDQVRIHRARPRRLPAPRGARSGVHRPRRARTSSVGAANAFLKTLEEPRPGTHFILLTSRGDRLLNTIRSRTLPVRFAPLLGGPHPRRPP